MGLGVRVLLGSLLQLSSRRRNHPPWTIDVVELDLLPLCTAKLAWPAEQQWGQAQCATNWQGSTEPIDRAKKFGHFEATSAIVTSYYWHFVDVVWIALFIIIYFLK